jgi:hypothetical protein
MSQLWQLRCDAVLHQLAGYPVIRPDGGWSLLIDTRPLGLTAADLSRLPFDRAKTAATPMDGWGPSGTHHLRIVSPTNPSNASPVWEIASARRSDDPQRPGCTHQVIGTAQRSAIEGS